MASKREKKNGITISKGVFVFFVFAVIMIVYLGLSRFSDVEVTTDSKDFHIIASDENKDLEEMLTQYASDNRVKLKFSYYGTIDMMQKLNSNPQEYDAVWPSNSIWLYMLEDDVSRKITDSKFTSINPVIFGVDIDLAKELGFYGRDDVELKEILDAVEQGKLKFIMPSATQTNSGASAYLSFLTTFAGNPQVLTEKNLEDEQLKKDLSSLLSGVSRSSGSEDYAIDVYLNGGYQALVGYESSIIGLNQQLEEEGRNPVYAIYPVDGVSLSDSPFAYVDNGNETKKEQFELLQDYLLGEHMQKALTATGRRGGYGGLVPYGTDQVFNPDWGIEKDRYLSPVKYPSTPVIIKSLAMYQNEFRKPSYTIFLLDYSGSMYGTGYDQLVSAMGMILNTEEASKRMIQFSQRDYIEIIAFSSEVLGGIESKDVDNTEDLMDFITYLTPMGGTDIYEPILETIERAMVVDKNKYNVSYILMTDGMSAAEEKIDYIRYFYNNGADIPVFAITFGEADTRQLEKLAEVTGGMVFDGVSDLVHAFQTVRGYN